MDNQKEQYREYLDRPEWKTLRAKAYERADNRCELCFSPAGAVHHIKYPKQFEGDCLENLLVVCEKCHKKLHGIKDLNVGITSNEEIFVWEHSHKFSELTNRIFKEGMPLEELPMILFIFGARLISEMKKNMYRVD